MFSYQQFDWSNPHFQGTLFPSAADAAAKEEDEDVLPLFPRAIASTDARFKASIPPMPLNLNLDMNRYEQFHNVNGS